MPSGATIDRLDVPGFGPVDASLVDAANATVFVRARDIGLTGVELPEQLEAKPEILKLLDNIRVAGSVRMGIAPDIDAARAVMLDGAGFGQIAPHLLFLGATALAFLAFGAWSFRWRIE